MVIPTHDTTPELDLPDPETPGQEAAQTILEAAATFQASFRQHSDKMLVALDVSHALMSLGLELRDEESLSEEDRTDTQSALVLLGDRILSEIYGSSEEISDRTFTLLERFALIMQPGSWKTAHIARGTLPELSEVMA
jgi:hypothetical protein